ncbi:MAG: TolC family protein [Desulfobacteraceae bacterium]|nr:TolC family protein [Desulfobacteraceae bacterium]
MTRSKTPWRYWILAVMLVVMPAGAAAAGGVSSTVNGTMENLPHEPEPMVPIPKTGPLRLTLAGAVIMALENNRALLVEKLDPRIRETYIDEERAVFDPLAQGGLTVGRTDRLGPDDDGRREITEKDTDAVVSLSRLFPAGTTVALEAGATLSDTNLYHDPFAETAVGLSVTQALLRDFGTAVNTVRLRQAHLDTQISQHELQGFGEALVARVEAAYYNLALARRQVDIVKESLRVAEQQLTETEQMIVVGTLAEAELPAVQAEVALQRQALIAAEGERETLRLELLRLLNPPGGTFWDREVTLIHPPEVPEVQLAPVADHVAVALRMRPELRQAYLEIERRQLTVVQTQNGLLPRLDLFISLGKTGFTDSFSRSIESLDDDHYTMQAGLQFAYPPANRAAQARHRRARLQERQAEEALANLRQLVEMDVRRAHIDVHRAHRQIAASTATRQFQEEKARIEVEKFRVGRSTNFLVAQAQRDLLSSRITEVEAVVDYLNALTDLFRLDGSLLARRGLTVAREEPSPGALSATRGPG